MIKKFLRQSRAVLFLRVWSEIMHYVFLYTKYLANGNRYNDRTKFKTDLLIRVHAIEKGLSIGSVKAGFGQTKVLALLKDLESYHFKYSDDVFLSLALSIIEKYIQFNKGNDIDKKIEYMYANLEKQIEKSVDFSDDSGVKLISRNELMRQQVSSFEVFSQSRYSVRDFSQEKINPVQVYEALKLCQRTPSACNRQSWHVYLFWNEKQRKRIFEIQGGCRGFSQDMQCAMSITGNVSRYNINELHQVYVDGGLYAMNMMYALHAKGLANIPLTMGHKIKKIKTIYREFAIPENEVPIVLIGIGTYKDSFKVAASHREDYHTYMTEFK